MLLTAGARDGACGRAVAAHIDERSGCGTRAREHTSPRTAGNTRLVSAASARLTDPSSGATPARHTPAGTIRASRTSPFALAASHAEASPQAARARNLQPHALCRPTPRVLWLCRPQPGGEIPRVSLLSPDTILGGALDFDETCALRVSNWEGAKRLPRGDRRCWRANGGPQAAIRALGRECRPAAR